MKIFLQYIKLINFKGTSNQTINFTDTTNVYGDNATGKTTIVDAWCWLLFGKDSADRKDFNIKPLDEHNRPTRQIECEVSAQLMAGNDAVNLKRVFREKWTKKRGASEAEFTGNETLYFWNDVPLSQSEYQKKIGEMLDESIFKLITNPLYFNQQLKWQERRNVLMQIAGDITDAEVANTNTDFHIISEVLNSNKSVDEFKREVAAKRKKIREQLESIPTRIDEASRNKPAAVDFTAVEAAINRKEQELDSVRESILDATKRQQDVQDKYMKIQREVFELQRQAEDWKNKRRNEILAADREATKGLDDIRAAIIRVNNDISRKKAEISNKHNEIGKAKEQAEKYESTCSWLRDDWNAKNAESITFNDSDFCCPTCKRAFEQSDIDARKEQMVANFNKAKQEALADITERGKQAAKQRDHYKEQAATLESELLTLTDELHQLENDLVNLESSLNAARAELGNPRPVEERLAEVLESDDRYQSILKDIAAKQELLNNQEKVQVDEELRSRERNLQTEIQSLRNQLAIKDQIVAIDARIEDLKSEERKLAQEMVQLEGIEFTIQQFTKAKIDMLEQRINNRFSFVKFKMFNPLINGGEEECCEALINGVPFSDANTAAKTQAGIDIINVLSRHYDVTAPIFLDNRESVVTIPETEAQIINMYVVPGAKLSVGTIEYVPDYKIEQVAAVA